MWPGKAPTPPSKCDKPAFLQVCAQGRSNVADFQAQDCRQREARRRGHPGPATHLLICSFRIGYLTALPSAEVTVACHSRLPWAAWVQSQFSFT